MNKKKLFITLALVAVIACAALLFGACEMMGDADPDDMGIADMNGGERLVTGLLVAAMGLIVVFVVLIVLIFLIKVFKVLIDAAEKASEKRAEENKGKEKKTFAERMQERKAAKAAEKQALLEAARARLNKTGQAGQESPVSDDGEEEEIAAVMAAIYAFYDSMPAQERSNLKFRVRSIKQIK